MKLVKDILGIFHRASAVGLALQGGHTLTCCLTVMKPFTRLQSTGTIYVNAGVNTLDLTIIRFPAESLTHTEHANTGIEPRPLGIIKKNHSTAFCVGTVNAWLITRHSLSQKAAQQYMKIYKAVKYTRCVNSAITVYLGFNRFSYTQNEQRRCFSAWFTLVVVLYMGPTGDRF